MNYFILNSAALIAKRSIYIKERDRLCKKPYPIECRNNSGFDVDDKNDFNYIKANLKNMELNLENLKFETINAPYPIGFFDEFIDAEICKKSL